MTFCPAVEYDGKIRTSCVNPGKHLKKLLVSTTSGRDTNIITYVVVEVCDKHNRGGFYEVLEK